MKWKEVRKELKKRLPKVRKQKVYLDLLKELHKRGATSKKIVLKTKQLEHISKDAGICLARLEKKKFVGIIKKGAARFLLDPIAKGSDCFCHTLPEIKKAREVRCLNLLKHIDGNPTLIAICAKVLGLKGKITLDNIKSKICYMDDRQRDKENLGNYNNIVRKLREKGIEMPNYDELIWLRGSYSWYIKEEFVIEFS